MACRQRAAPPDEDRGCPRRALAHRNVADPRPVGSLDVVPDAPWAELAEIPPDQPGPRKGLACRTAPHFARLRRPLGGSASAGRRVAPRTGFRPVTTACHYNPGVARPAGRCPGPDEADV